MLDVSVLPAHADQTSLVAERLAQAFVDEASIVAILGPGGQALPRLSAMLELQLRHEYLPHGVVDLAWAGDELVGVALWSPPHSAAGSFRAELRLAPRYLRVLGPRFLRAVRTELTTSRVHPKTPPHWYLYMIGVPPEGRGKGVGNALLAHRLGRIPASDPAYLEASSEGSARLYARHGFVPRGTIRLFTGAPLYAMWRPGLP